MGIFVKYRLVLSVLLVLRYQTYSGIVIQNQLINLKYYKLFKPESTF